MTSDAPSKDSITASQVPSATPTAHQSGTSSPASAVPAQQPAASYASATKKQSVTPQPPSIASSTPNAAAAPSQHGDLNSPSPVNGTASIRPAVPNVGGGGPTIVHSAASGGNADTGAQAKASSAPAQPFHGRRQSSVTISASGASGYTTNGGPIAPSSRPNISFGSMNASGSPALAHSVPHHSQSASLSAAAAAAAAHSPASSPSPIPQQPASSGGRPPSLGGPGNGLNFVAMAENGDSGHTRPASMQPSPHALNQTPQHLRRESAQSAHSDMSGAGMNNMNRNFVPHGGRGRGFQPPYGGAVPQSPGQGFRPSPGNQRPGPGMPNQFQSQGPMAPHPHSPYRNTRSPAMTPATMQQQVHLANNQPMPHGAYGGFPPHLQPQQTVRLPYFSPRVSSSEHPSAVPSEGLRRRRESSETASQPSPPQPEFADFSKPFPPPHLSPEHGGFDHLLTIVKGPAMYGMPSGYDQYGYYHPPAYGNYPQAPYAGDHPSPRPFHATPHGQAPFVHGQFGNAPPPHGQNMSRTPSQQSERPPSTSVQPSAAPPIASSSHAHQPKPSSSSPAPAAASKDFAIPQRGKGIVIRRPDGEVVTFDKKSSPAPQPSRSPAGAPVMVSSSPTPAAAQHGRNESKASIDAEKKKLDFQEQVKKQLEMEERRKRDEKTATAAQKEESAPKTAEVAEEAETKVTKPSDAAADVDSKPSQSQAAPVETDAEAKKRQEDEEMERMIAEMEAAEKAEEEREKKFREEKRVKDEAAKKAEAERAIADLKRQEAEADAAELAKEQKAAAGSSDDSDAKAMFAALKKPTVGPGANASGGDEESRSSTPASEAAMPPPPPQRVPSSGPLSAGRPRPANLKLDTHKPVEPPQPTPGMQALKSARFIQVQSEILYPSGIRSPNPALNQGPKKKGERYDKMFLLQFQEAFKEKPSVDWENRVKETVGDTDSARATSARTPLGGGGGGGSQARQRGNFSSGMNQGAMGSFQGARTIGIGGSQDRFGGMPHQSGFKPATMTNPLQGIPRAGGGFPMGSTSMSRTNSLQAMGQGPGPSSPRVGSARGKGSGSRRAGLDKSASRRDDERDAKTMPLTAGQELKPLEASRSGWKPSSVGVGGSSSQPLPGGRLPPDVVQRKVKAALNKMTPEKFDRISDSILEIAAQSKDETDGRTLRQVIALTFEKACDEAHWASMYAKFCKRMLETMSVDIRDENVTKGGAPIVGGALFRKYLLNRCQEEFERGWEVNLPTKEDGGEQEAALLSDEYYVAAAAKRRGLGLVQFIGELYKLSMLTIRIMHECVHKLLNFQGLPNESTVESFTKLLRTIGSTMEASETGPRMLDAYFDRIGDVMKLEGLPSRLYYMLMDVVDLRKNKWVSKDNAKGPKTITEIREEAAQAQQQAELERQRQNARGHGRPPMGRGDARNFSGGGMMPPPDYPRNTVGMDDLRRLGRGQSGRQVSQTQSSFGPVSLLGSRSNSGRNRLGASGMAKTGDDSGGSSRTGTPPVKDKESSSHANQFSALADLSGEGADEGATPSSAANSPPVVKSKPMESSSLSKQVSSSGPETSMTGDDKDKDNANGNASGTPAAS